MSNISRSKGNQTMKCGQFIVYNMKKNFLLKLCTKYGGETSPRLFQIPSLKFCTVCFYWMSSWGLLKYIETKVQSTCFELILIFFKKTKRGLELVSMVPHFLHNFGRRHMLCFLLLTDQVSYLVVFTLWNIWQYVYCNYLLTRLWGHEFWN